MHFTPYEPDGFAIGGKMMADTGGRDVTVEFSDGGLSLRCQRVIARKRPVTMGSARSAPGGRTPSLLTSQLLTIWI